MTRGRFAPSPTGRMHLGNVFCALLSWLSAKSKGGEWVLRIEDLDPQRSRREYALQLMDDLQWLGLPWDGEPVWQSQRGHIYEEYLHRLTEMGLTYPCFCTRADIMATQAPHETDGRVVYKGTCRPKYTDAARSVPTSSEEDNSFNVQRSTFAPQTVPLRQGANEVFREMTECHFVPHEGSTIQCDAGPVRERSGGGGLTAHPSSLNVQHSTFNIQHSPLTVNFFHHPLLCNAEGQRLCKRDKSMDLGYLRDKGTTPQEIIGLLAHLAGLTDTPAPITPQELIPLFSWDKVPTEDIRIKI